MSIANDERIIFLKKKIEEKKANLKGMCTRAIPRTSCLITLDGVKYNLHITGEPFIMLTLKLKSLAMAADALGMSTDDIPIDGFSLTDWLNDIKEFAEVEHARSMLADLRATEKKLDSLLSVDKKTELELDNLAASLEADDKNE